jgi:hypothetical protein
MSWALLDSGVYIGHWERGLYGDALAWVRRAFIVRHSAVVLSELRRGARTRRARDLVDRLHETATSCWAPTDEDWWDAGRLVRDVGDERGWEPVKRREFQNDRVLRFRCWSTKMRSRLPNPVELPTNGTGAG